MISQELNQKIHFYLTCLLAFFTPIHPKILPILIILLCVNWVINPTNIKQSYKTLSSNLVLSTTAILYLMYLIGMLYSSNLGFGGRVLETKMSLIILPIIYSAYINVTKEKLNHYLKIFVYGCIVYALICFSYATYAYFLPLEIDLGNGYTFNYGANYFYYYYLSVFFHPSYTAMYSVFALAIIVFGIKKELIQFNWKTILTIILLTIFVLLLSSKAGWITLFLLCFYTFYLLVSKKKIIHTLYFIVPITVAFLVFNVYYTPLVSQRLPDVKAITNVVTEKNEKNEVVTTSKDGNAARILIWKASVELFVNNFLIGTGTGDSKDELLKIYHAKEMTTEYENKLNSHNQFLTTAISLGFIGLLIMLFTFLLPFYFSISTKNYLISAFIILISFNLLFESMYETQAGIVFYAFFNTLLCSTFVKNYSEKKSQ
ncbi:MAG: O-antigen ligase family protein [Flavobacteriales bacterium]|nr:O-antigen ligase family protein [Flavobacteriales bacterium]